MGFRNILGLCETIKFDTSKSFDYQKKASASFDLSFPEFYKETMLNIGYSISDRNIDENIHEVSDSTFIRVSNYSGTKYAMYTDMIRTN